jgi:hypothetical protein
MKRNILVGLVAIATVLVSADPADAARRIIEYEGKLLDERGAPIGGVFPLTFAFYNRSRGGSAIWSERHFVAVDAGTYTVELGRQSTIPRSVNLDRLFVGVRITGGPELVREQFIAAGATPEQIVRQQRPSDNNPRQPGGSTVEFANKAGMAHLAETADVARRLEDTNGGRTLSFEDLKREFGGQRGGDSNITVGLGDNAFNSPTAGGEGGTPYTLLCPEGYVVTGVRGGSGLYIDRVGIVCSPLETRSGN